LGGISFYIFARRFRASRRGAEIYNLVAHQKMPIEDVDTLLTQGKEKSFVFYVDSSKRDRVAYPTPDKFAMSFDEPFRNVIGIDILDSSIPNTQLNVDEPNCLLQFTYAEAPVSTLATETEFHHMLDRYDPVYDFLMNDDPFAVDSTVNSYDVYVCDAANPPVLTPGAEADATKMLVYQTLVEDVVAATTPAPGNVKLLRRARPGDAHADVEIDPSVYPELAWAADAGYVWEVAPAGSGLPGAYDVRVLELQTSGIGIDDAKELMQSGSCVMHLCTRNTRVAYGNYDITTLKQTLNSMVSPIKVIPYFPTDDIRRSEYKFVSPSPFLLQIDRSTLGTTIGFDLLPGTGSNKEGHVIYEPAPWRARRQLFAPIYDPNSTYWNIAAPGAVDLLGIRYVTLHCPEIESHVYGSFAFTQFSPGIGIFKMSAGSASGVTQLRFDFVNVVRKNFHPVGKLSKLTFQFLDPNGKPYNFRSVNLQLLIAIKTLVPDTVGRLPRSILNPNYQADVQAYLNANNPDDVEAQHQDPDYEPDTQRIRRIEDELDYSSSDDDTATDSSSEYEFPALPAPTANDGVL
jgi:hypothetical protein